MFGSHSRWGWLTVFAVVNLIFWLGVAVAVGLLAGRKVDLGIEQSVREYQATAAVVLRRTTRTAPATGRPAARPSWPQPSRVAANTPSPAPSRAPAATATPFPFDTPALQPKPRSPVTVTPRPAATAVPLPTVQPLSPPPTVRSAAPPSAALPTDAPIRRPLLLANPSFQDLSEMDREMARSAVGRPVQIRYHEAELNREIAALLAENPDLPYHDVSVDLQPDRAVVRGSTEVLSVPVQVEVTGRVTAVDCRPQIEVEKVAVAGLFTPSFVQDQVQEMIAEVETWYPADYPLCLEQIVLEEDRATVYGHRR